MNIQTVPPSVGRTPLHDVHVELGASFTDFSGWQMPLRYGSETAEHHAVRSAAGIFDLTHMGELLDEFALLAVQGPAAAAVIAEVTDAPLGVLGYYRSVPATVAGVSAILTRTGYTGEDGFEIYVAPSSAEQLWHALMKAGAGYGLVAAGLSCRDTLRLEAGMPLYGHELDVSVTPFEAGLGRVVRFDKPGDFVGRGALSSQRDAAPRQVLVGLMATGRRVPRHGQVVVTAAGQVIGRVTSGTPSPTLGRPIALAYVPPSHAEVGTVLAVDVRGSRESVEVVALPFYRRPR